MKATYLFKILLSLQLYSLMVTSLDHGFLRELDYAYSAATTCTADTGCTSIYNSCCATVYRGGTSIGSKLCIPIDFYKSIGTNSITINSQFYTFSCASSPSPTYVSCSTNLDCSSVTNGCCATRSVNVLTAAGPTQDNVCIVNTYSGLISYTYTANLFTGTIQ